GFNFLKGQPLDVEEKWRSRGILQIEGKGNYEKLNDLEKSVNWVKYPKKLGYLTRNAVVASIKFWSFLVKNAKNKDKKFKLDFLSALKLLNTREVQKPFKEEYRENLLNRLEVYKTVKKLLRNYA
ncbi:hypothetical protein H311_01862, partial [Anncaliia algerae PRA109]